MGYGLEGKTRLVLNIIVPRKNFPELQNTLEEHGNVNMAVKTVTKVTGKVGYKQIPETQQ